MHVRLLQQMQDSLSVHRVRKMKSTMAVLFSQPHTHITATNMFHSVFIITPFKLIHGSNILLSVLVL